MECEHCLESYDESQHMPFCIHPCSHTYCIQCLFKTKSTEGKCYKCDARIEDVEPNYALLSMLPRSSYGKLKHELELTINRVNELKHNFDMKKELKLEELINKVIQMRRQIRLKANHLIDKIQERKHKLVDITRNLESYLIRTLNEIQIDKHLFMKNHDIKVNLKNNVYSETDLELIIDELNEKKESISNKFILLEKLDEYEFVPNDSLSLGEIKNVKWTREPTSSREFIEKGVILYKQLKDYESAVECFSKSLSENQKRLNAVALNWKGVCLYELKKYTESIECYDKALEIDSASSAAYCNKGAAYREMREFKSALDTFDKAIQLDPNSYYGYFNKGLTCYYERDFKQALEYFNKASEIKQSDACIWNWKGNCFKELNDLKRALNCYNKAIQLNSNYENAYLNKQNVLKILQSRMTN